MEPIVNPSLPNEYNAVLRHVLNTLGSLLAAHGLVTASDWQIYAGAVAALAPYAFAWIVARRNKRKMQQLSNVAIATNVIAIQSEFAKPEVHTLEDAKDNVIQQVKEEIRKNGFATV